MNFKEIFFPLTYVSGSAYNPEWHKVFDFAMPLLNSVDGIIISSELQKDIVDIFNGKSGNIDGNLTYNKGIIYLNDKVFIVIRGWGYLTGSGGLHLTSEEAILIQDNLAEFLINKLKGLC